MMIKTVQLMGFPCLMALCLTVALAQDLAADENGPWSGRVLLGYLATDGNTENTSANLEAELGWRGERWQQLLSGRAIGQNQTDTETDIKNTTAESYKATYEARFSMTKRNYLFGLLDYNKNRFTTYTRQTFQFVGFGRRWIETERHQLNAEIGAGASQSKLNENFLLPSEPNSVNEANARISGDYKWKISDNATFVQNLSVNAGRSNTFTESVTELSANIYGALAMVLSYKIQNNSDVLPGTEKTDTFTSISLEYGFGK